MLINILTLCMHRVHVHDVDNLETDNSVSEWNPPLYMQGRIEDPVCTISRKDYALSSRIVMHKHNPRRKHVQLNLSQLTLDQLLLLRDLDNDVPMFNQ